MIHVIARIEVQAGKRDEFLEHFRKIIADVRQEDGCLEYGPTVDVGTGIDAVDGPHEAVVTVIEKWESLDALRRHLEAPHMQAYRREVKDLVVATRLLVTQPC